jgi:hypothetical protein
VFAFQDLMRVAMIVVDEADVELLAEVLAVGVGLR